MFKNIFSFDGRIRRTEYWLTAILIQFVLVPLIVTIGGLTLVGFLLIVVPLWISLAAGVKRSHDLGNSGWLILIPFYNPFFLAFGGSQPYTNVYGPNPKGFEMSPYSTPVVVNNFLNKPEEKLTGQAELVTEAIENQLKPVTVMANVETKPIADKIGDGAKNLVSSIGKAIDKGVGSETKKISHLKELKELLDLGVLTQEEYNEQKNKILNNM